MADFARAMQTPPPGTPVPAPQPAGTVLDVRAMDAHAARQAKNERDRQRRAAKRAADAKANAAAAKKAAVPKKKKAKAKRKPAAVVAVPKKKRGRGRPPGAKNRPKIGVVGTPGTTAKAVAQVVARTPSVSIITPLSIVVAMARMTAHDRTETLVAIRAAFFDA